MAADQGVIDSVSNVNTKTFGDGPAFYAQLAMGNAVSHQGRVNQVGEAALSAAIKNLLTISPEQAAADATVSEGSLPGITTALLTALAAGQIGAKEAGNTPPVTINGTLPK